MSTRAAPVENGFCIGGSSDDGVANAKRIKLSPAQTPAEMNHTSKPVLATANGRTTTTERRKSATSRQGEVDKVVENGHHDATVAATDAAAAAAGVGDEKVPATARRNQDGEISDGYVTTEDWKTKWQRGKTKFHKTQVHGMLKKHYHRLVKGKEKPGFFVPLCGKTVDMVWLLENGCSVVGCEIAEMAVQQFFTENDIEYTTEALEDIGGTVYKGKDKDITIYSADFFKLSSALMGKFDCIWDRGSMAAINPNDRKRYCDVITDVLKPDAHYLLDAFEVPHDVFSGPPHNMDPAEVKQLYGAVCDIEQLEHVDAMNPWSKTWGVAYFYENDFLLTPKK